MKKLTCTKCQEQTSPLKKFGKHLLCPACSPTNWSVKSGG
jgi:Zn finger protein HypA/HybF involved in hydrogenase expression